MFWRARYAVFGPISFCSQLDTAKIIERTFRRADILPDFTGGFTPRPRFSFGPARPTGFSSVAEIFDFSIRKEVGKEFLIDSFNRYAPDGMKLLNAKKIEKEKFSRINKQAKFMDYVIFFKHCDKSHRILKEFDKLIAETHLHLKKMSKTLPIIEKSIGNLLEEGNSDKILFNRGVKVVEQHVRYDLSERGSLRVDKVINEAALASLGRDVFKTNLILSIFIKEIWRKEGAVLKPFLKKER